MKNHVYLVIHSNKKGACMAKFRKRIIIDVSTQEHEEIKMRAVRRRVTMSHYILAAVEQQIMQERKYEDEYDLIQRRDPDNK
jgi:hypothetical protein